MKPIKVSYDKIKYDERHDILHVFLGSPIDAFADEEFPGIYVSRNDDTNDIVGLTIIDYTKKKQLLKNYFPNIFK
ncbi:DUF2283 domain-containing protein [Megamonas hypermegale]|uniref:DUF2283 domain-containing protein n=1 Tax=Megamonas hypermegale TaxID=158847 RepID=UPI0026EF4ED4|nr:DUF2283 domain-containing protein [Megamonas hypermegale]